MKTRGGGIVIGGDSIQKAERKRPTASARKDKRELIYQSKKSRKVAEPVRVSGEVQEQSNSDDHDDDYIVTPSLPPKLSKKSKGKQIATNEEELESGEDEYDEDVEVDEAEALGTEEELENVDIGTPNDPSLLVDYKDHVASDIWVGVERVLPTFRHHYGRYASSNGWELSQEPVKVQKIIRGSGLMNLLKYPKQYLDKPLLSAFVERWYPETNTFHFPFGEMTITLDDVSRILGIPVVGQTFKGTYKSRDRCMKWLEEGLGIHMRDIIDEFTKNKCLSVDLNWLMINTIKVKSTSSDFHMSMRARGYLLYLLGSTLLSDKTGTRVSVVYLESLLDLDVVPTYNWGSTALAYLYRQLGSCSRSSVKQMAGFLLLLETWILDHFYVRGIPNLDFIVGEEPTLNRWLSQSHGAVLGNSELVGIREHLDRLAPNSVTWHCFPESYPVQPITWYSGCLICYETVEAYHPERVLRQMGRVQGIPKDPFRTTKDDRAKRGRGNKVEFPMLEMYGNDWESHILAPSQQGREVSYPFECSDDYIEWFYNVSHPIFTNPVRCKSRVLYNSTKHYDELLKKMSHLGCR